MCRLARLFGRQPSKPAVPAAQVPGVLRRGSAALSGADLIRSFGTGETKSYALKGVSVEFRKGDLNLLMGPSGSGKSTLLAVLSGLLRPDNGAVGALGRDVWRMSETQMERFRLQHCSYIFQGYNLFPALTAREQLEIVLKWGEGCSPREARHRADKVLGQLGLANKAHLRPAEMSGGEKQRVAIGRALVKNPSLVFADEPTAALDWDNGQQVIKLLTENARERGAMVLVVTHDPRLVQFADKVMELEDGQLTQDGPPADALSRHDVHEFTPPPVKKGPRLRLHAPTANVP
ncbi:abc transporter atp-binding protein : ABC-type antimicrobial peptide transport system, ATPase component OS=Singulisphaera acidiphila (strain ATCC BAA-1392 / DSM 18658 / VKM B-2454 / MOB10) GN=Sinac_2085 PE=3 SV=1: ABC_tran [Gemmataceae bacterium]|nr:abc transporter atp-binding protein : ABC-type antimicrobial peptide transport system, ATPase component OS=Singulisphaera acidiphila (strain ATCC BAA-1392 / DSM 18658 / VKM B-2454 / MOB10) GN=Sinac_2085 PE=3 SV=1: ABC_tran [Gemmataceae bacterium]VTU02106.1 abc transporter atp-binding protein : ABC-type antimicrobial peptide transport system, ATPase component OS=Singulisphaera acidiphila (strain ATCC BAA-1392 / DSM 18658 / VKM B-2454 / MOB10) GN=Sinac_2085 PE=3 SV=1: ABC_tran [Gemmataceae bacter